MDLGFLLPGWGWYNIVFGGVWGGFGFLRWCVLGCFGAFQFEFCGFAFVY